MIAGDAVMLLSNAWTDANAGGPATMPTVPVVSAPITGTVKAVGSRLATATSVNAFIIAGIVPSGSDTDGNNATQEYNYSGGFENFFRYLETWSGRNQTFVGSRACLFTSAKYTGRWQNNADIYSPPIRVWAWDARYGTEAAPGTPLGWISLSSSRLRGDFDGSGCTNVYDFLYLLDHWTGGPDVPLIGTDDFLALLDHWTEGSGCT